MQSMIPQPLRIIFRTVRTFKYHQCRMASTSSIQIEKQKCVEKIKSEFSQYKGGSVIVSRDEDRGIAQICINHPEKKNGLSGQMMVELHNAVVSLEEWKTGKGVILYGKGDVFCSGGHLETVKQICTSEAGIKMCTLMQDSTTRLRSLPFLSVAVIQGVAIGGGAELTLSTDWRVMTKSAEIGFVQGRMGVGTGWGGGYALTNIVGRSKALNLLLTGRRIDSTEALAIGIADSVIGENEGKSEESRIKYTVSWLEDKIGRYDPSVVQILKQTIDAGDLEKEKELFGKLWGGPIQQKALSQNIKHK